MALVQNEYQEAGKIFCFPVCPPYFMKVMERFVKSPETLNPWVFEVVSPDGFEPSTY